MAVKKGKAKTELATEKENEPKSTRKINWTVVLGVPGVIIAILTYNHSIEKDKVAAATETQKLVTDYEEKVSKFIDENEQLYNNTGSSKRLTFTTNSEEKIPLAISYASLNHKWVSIGYLKLDQAEPFSFHRTDNSFIYLYLDLNSFNLTDKTILINSVNISELKTESREVRSDNKPFTILHEIEPPYPTVQKTFYKINIPDNNIINIQIVTLK